MSIGHVCALFAEVSIQVFCVFFNCVVCFCGDEFYKFFVTLDVNPLSDVWVNMFSLSVGCLFIFLMISIAVQELLL